MKMLLTGICLSALAVFVSPVRPDLFVNSADRLQTIAERFPPPAGFQRIVLADDAFGSWLRRLPLLDEPAEVTDYRGTLFKPASDSTVAAVVALNVKGRRLEQCMDILMKMYAGFLAGEDRRQEIRFPLPDGLLLSWKDWAAGYRPEFKGLHFFLQQTAPADQSAENFRRYMNTLFSYTGSQTFYHHYRTVSPGELRPGDFIVRKDRKGHAVMIVDLAENAAGDRKMLVGQGDTPACGFYLLSYKQEQAWFPVDTTRPVLPLPIRKQMYWQGLRRFDQHSVLPLNTE